MRKSEINAKSQSSGNLQRDFHKFSRIPQLGSINDDVSKTEKKPSKKSDISPNSMSYHRKVPPFSKVRCRLFRGNENSSLDLSTVKNSVLLIDQNK